MEYGFKEVSLVSWLRLQVLCLNLGFAVRELCNLEQYT